MSIATPPSARPTARRTRAAPASSAATCCACCARSASKRGPPARRKKAQEGRPAPQPKEACLRLAGIVGPANNGGPCKTSRVATAPSLAPTARHAEASLAASDEFDEGAAVFAPHFDVSRFQVLLDEGQLSQTEYEQARLASASTTADSPTS